MAYKTQQEITSADIVFYMRTMEEMIEAYAYSINDMQMLKSLSICLLNT